MLQELHATLKPRGVLFSSNPRGDNEEGWNGGRYGVYHDLNSWRNYMSTAGFVEINHYYRPVGLPREKQPCESAIRSGDLVIANDAATPPASLKGIHCPSGRRIEVRLAAWISAGNPTQFVAIGFGTGDYRTRTEHRLRPPALSPGDRLAFGLLRRQSSVCSTMPFWFR